jgi:hypothetical protein
LDIGLMQEAKISKNRVYGSQEGFWFFKTWMKRNGLWFLFCIDSNNNTKLQKISDLIYKRYIRNDFCVCVVEVVFS